MTKSKGSAKKSKIAWGKALLLLLVAAWMFVVGVMVGRGTAPVHFDLAALQKQVDELRQAAVKKERDAVERAVRGENQKATLEFYEKLKRDGLDTSVNIPAGGGGAGSGSAAHASGVLSIPHKSRALLMGKDAEKAAENKPRTPSSKATVKTATGSGPLTIQVASLKDGDEAWRIVANLRKDGYSAYVSKVVIPEKGLWYRVRVGSYADAKHAATDMARLTKAQKQPILLEK